MSGHHRNLCRDIKVVELETLPLGPPSLYFHPAFISSLLIFALTATISTPLSLPLPRYHHYHHHPPLPLPSTISLHCFPFPSLFLSLLACRPCVALLLSSLPTPYLRSPALSLFPPSLLPLPFTFALSLAPLSHISRLPLILALSCLHRHRFSCPPRFSYLPFQNAINTQQQWPQSIPPLGSIRLVVAQEVPRAGEGQT